MSLYVFATTSCFAPEDMRRAAFLGPFSVFSATFIFAASASRFSASAHLVEDRRVENLYLSRVETRPPTAYRVLFS